MALTKTPLTQPSPRNPTIITRWVKVKARILEAAKRHQAIYHGSLVHLAALACLGATSAVLEAFQRASFGWYLFCATMVLGYFYDLKDQRQRGKHRDPAVRGEPEAISSGRDGNRRGGDVMGSGLE